MHAAREGFDYVDIELTSKDACRVIHKVRQDGARVIISHHNQKLTPAESTLKSILAKEKRAGADICKIVCTARELRG